MLLLTREQAKRIVKRIVQNHGQIDAEGYITGCPVFTSAIEVILANNGKVWFDNACGRIQISNWPLDFKEEVEPGEYQVKIVEIRRVKFERDMVTIEVTGGKTKGKRVEMLI